MNQPLLGEGRQLPGTIHLLNNLFAWWEGSKQSRGPQARLRSIPREAQLDPPDEDKDH